MITSEQLALLTKQLAGGLIHEIEFLLQVQLSPEVVDRCIAMRKLPHKVWHKVIIDDLLSDELVPEPSASAEAERFAVVITKALDYHLPVGAVLDEDHITLMLTSAPNLALMHVKLDTLFKTQNNAARFAVDSTNMRIKISLRALRNVGIIPPHELLVIEPLRNQRRLDDYLFAYKQTFFTQLGDKMRKLQDGFKVQAYWGALYFRSDDDTMHDELMFACKANNIGFTIASADSTHITFKELAKFGCPVPESITSQVKSKD